MNAHLSWTSILAAALLAVGACGRAPEGWTPVLEETSAAYLETELERTLNRVSAARERLRSDPDRAADLLRSAQEGVEALDGVYLPLFRARGRAYNAYRHHYLGRDDQAARELDAIEDAVLGVSRGAEGALLRELEQIQELVVDARIELQAGSPAATAALQELAVALEAFVAKGDLFL